MLRRIVNFSRHDWKHLLFCARVMLRGFWIGDAGMVEEGWLFFWMHLKYDSRRIK